MKQRIMILFMAAVMLTSFALVPSSAMAATVEKSATALKKIAVTGTLSDGGTFAGKLTITGFNYDVAQGLLANGDLTGKATLADGTTKNVKQSFASIPVALIAGGSSQASAKVASILPMIVPQQTAACDILSLDLGPLHLDLLGLVVDLNEVNLDVTAVPGAGNLLGNLLCAVTGLLDGITQGTGLSGLLTQILQSVLDALNGLLG